jgi:hypothetical protein
VAVLVQHQYADSVVVAADADVVQASGNAQGDGSGLVDAVGANAAADFTALPVKWHRRLAAVAHRVFRHPLSHLDSDWENAPSAL